MIREFTIRNFKRFQDATFTLPGHVVLAGPNNTGKTTALQAIAAWSLAFRQWKERNNFQRRGGAYTKVPIARQAFSAVPLRSFDLLWRERDYTGTIEIEVRSEDGWAIPIEFVADSTEQVYVRPKSEVDPEVLKATRLDTVFVPAMTGLAKEEPLYASPATVEDLLGQARPGEVLRNLLVDAHRTDSAWNALCDSISKLFGYTLLPPDAKGAYIVSEYRTRREGPHLDISSAGSGFQQVLMLLTFLNTHPASVLLLDEPDAHLHVILQDSIYGELRRVAAKQKSQLIVATHSEVIIDTVEAQEICVILDQPRLLSDTRERNALKQSLRVLSNTDIMQAMDADGVLYLEGHTDLDILCAWAEALGHAVAGFLQKPFWKPTVWEPREGGKGVKSRDHFAALQLVREDLPGLELVDGDAHPDIGPTEITGKGLQRLRWNRYEIESYLVHPEALARYVKFQFGEASAAPHLDSLRKHFEEKYPPSFLKDPFEDSPYLKNTKARTDLLPPALAAAGLPSIPHSRYHEIAALMTREIVHPEAIEKLDLIQKAFGIR